MVFTMSCLRSGLPLFDLSKQWVVSDSEGTSCMVCINHMNPFKFGNIHKMKQTQLRGHWRTFVLELAIKAMDKLLFHNITYPCLLDVCFWHEISHFITLTIDGNCLVFVNQYKVKIIGHLRILKKPCFLHGCTLENNVVLLYVGSYVTTYEQ